MINSHVANVGNSVVNLLDNFGKFCRFTGQVFRWTLRSAFHWNRIKLINPQLYQIGTRSVPVMMLVGGFVGMVLSVEAYDQFAAIGQEVRLGGIINISVVKQIGPVLAAVMLAGRIGSSISAEIGTMKVTEQLDALRVMGADPISYMVVPRVMACVLVIPVLTVISDLLGILGGYMVTVQGFGVNANAYWEFSSRFVGGYDLATGLVKSVAFGLMIGLISCYKGYYCRAGAKGVGEAATEAFVASFLAIIVSNFILAKFLKDLYYVIYGFGGPTAFS